MVVGSRVMKRMLLGGVAVAALGGVGCASSAEIQDVAYAHQQRAQYYQASGDYYRAAKEQESADKQFAKARQRAYEEAYYPRYFW
jgi:outer membrane murein-binding lipoprotein Lpp